ncbi:rod shape-determining protein MreD [Acinetobacter chinensis]|uniref:Rod shape-determining protein MreD n=1 Tax=Acinetobacter chinensis TaxID=2004650 RepID=A0ABU3WAT4_9GAMM|nr:rod shape-determining protein MreD [Acinetobacter chinensis]MDV2467519.1 rod shape-determining protein MreD [Acinetobacter chinensis]
MLIAKIRSHQKRDPLIAIVVSVLIASILMVYPLSYAVSGWRPSFMLMIMLFWVLCQPTWCGVWFAFGVGLFTDLLFDAPLGMNALSFVIITFVSRFLTRERRILTFSNLWIITTLALIAHLMLVWMMQTMGGIQVSITRYWQPMLTSAMIWPVIYFLLRRWRV